MNSLEAQIEVANSARIYECNASRTCDAIFSNLEQKGYHREAKHHIMNHGYSQNLYGSGAYYEQGNLMKRPWVFSDSSNRSTGDIYTPRRTYREVETPIWVSLNGNEQSSAHMINSSVMYENKETNGVSLHLEQPGQEYSQKC